jgi:hypothetical protein
VSAVDRFRRRNVQTAPETRVERPAPKPKTLRLAGQILRDDIFPSTTDTEQ